METTSSKAEVLKPVILPLAVSLAGFIYAWILSKESIPNAYSARANSPETDSQQGIAREESFHSLASMEDEEPIPIDNRVLPRSSVIYDSLCFEQEIACFHSSTIERIGVTFAVWPFLWLEGGRTNAYGYHKLVVAGDGLRWFLWFHPLRQRKGGWRISLSNMSKLWANFENKLLEKINWNSENKLLEKKVKKLVRKSEAQSRRIYEQTLIITAKEAEMIRTGVTNRLKMKSERSVLDELLDENKWIMNFWWSLKQHRSHLRLRKATDQRKK